MLKLREWMETGVPEYGLLSFGQVQELQEVIRCGRHRFQQLAQCASDSWCRFNPVCLERPPYPCPSSLLKIERDELAKHLESERAVLQRAKGEYARTLLELQQQQAAAAAAAASPTVVRRRKKSSASKKTPRSTSFR